MVIVFLYEDNVVLCGNENDMEQIHIGLGQISSGSRKYLKSVAQSLVDMQNSPDFIDQDYISQNGGTFSVGGLDSKLKMQKPRFLR